jgi:hypothetical protein
VTDAVVGGEITAHRPLLRRLVEGTILHILHKNVLLNEIIFQPNLVQRRGSRGK